MSSTSSSCFRFVPPHCGQASGALRATMGCGQPGLPSDPWQYHTGMRWPHQSWREMHQSRMLDIQCPYTLVQRSG